MGSGASDNLLRQPFHEVCIRPQCLMQQKDISVTKNPQIDISETPEGHLIAYYARYGILRPYILYILYCLEIEFVKTLWY